VGAKCAVSKAICRSNEWWFWSFQRKGAQQFYDSAEYRPILNLRLASTQSDVVFVQGYSG
jgi:Domain of unknown function (DUF1330)